MACEPMKKILMLGAIVVFSMWARGQTTQKPKTTPPASEKLQTPRKDPPTLGFNKVKDVSPVLDTDALAEENELKKKLPNNEFVGTKRLLHETGLMNEFVEGFKNSKECNGITLYLKADKKPDFTVQISVSGHDDHPDDQTWVWWLNYLADPSPLDSKAHGIGGMGSQSSGKLMARDVCMALWDDIDPNHFKKPGGKIE